MRLSDNGKGTTLGKGAGKRATPSKRATEWGPRIPANEGVLNLQEEDADWLNANSPVWEHCPQDVDWRTRLGKILKKAKFRLVWVPYMI